MKMINEYVDKFFEGTLSEAQESELKDFLSTPEGQASEYDEVRAVMGFFAVGKELRGKRKEEYSKTTVPARTVFARVAAVAASVMILFTFAVRVYNKENVCVSFVDGKKVTDKEVVMNDVENTLAELLTDGTDVDEQLSEFFNKQEK